VPQIGYELMANGQAKQTINPAALENTQNETDSGWLNKGYITYTLFGRILDAPAFQAQYEALLKK
jgi:5'-nucleotidase